MWDAEAIVWADAGTLAAAIRAGEVTAVEAVAAVLDRIAAVDEKIGAFVTVTAEAALATAAEIDGRRARGAPLGPLAGVPVSIKDIIYTKGVRTTAGSHLFADFVPDADAIVVERLKAAGAVVIGKTATPEFCHKTVTDSPLQGATRNPWDPSRTTGGSSGGSAAAVAAGCGPVSIGTDGGGSIRLPAALCGVAGFKPSVGRVPQYPGFPGWDILGHTGPLARSVADLRLMMAVIAGPDPRDPLSLHAAAAPAVPNDLSSLRVAVAASLNELEAEPEVAAGLAAVVAAARAAGMAPREVSLRWDDPELRFRVIVAADLAAALGRFLPEHRARMDPTLARMVEWGASLAAPDLAAALAWRTAFTRDVLAAFADIDVLLVPTGPVAAFPLGRIGPTEIAGRKVSPYAWFGWTWPFNLTGQPALSLPVLAKGSLPAGIQVVGRPGADDLVLTVGAALERAIGQPSVARRAP